jgi:pimeloyl-ACP methyl ester carboxylesterase
MTCLTFLLEALALLLVTAVVAACITFGYSFYFAPRFLFGRKPQTKPYVGQKRPPGLGRAFVRDIWTALFFYGGYVFFPFVGGYQRTPRQPGTIPIIFVHGYAVSRTSWFWFMRMLARRSVTRPMYVLEYNWLASAATSSKRLGRLIDRALREQSAKEVDVICHSWGGIVARWYVRTQGPSSRVRRLIMLSTPNQGTWMTLLGLGKPRAQMSIGSETVQTLWIASASPPIATLWGRCDQIVTPAQFSLLGDADGNPVVVREFGATAHLTMCRDNAVADTTAALLEADRW